MCSDKKPFTTVYKAMYGWNSVCLCWSEEDKLYIPWQTGHGPYGYSDEAKNIAICEAKEWAKSDEIEYRENKPS
jgi:hypothetical protein